MPIGCNLLSLLPISSRKKYPEAIACFKGCQFDLLADSERDACTLRMGTAYLKMGNLQEAAVWFSILKEVSSEYHIDAVYHLAYIDYVQKQYDKALQGFRETGESSKYAALSPYYIADIHLVRGKLPAGQTDRIYLSRSLSTPGKGNRDETHLRRSLLRLEAICCCH